MELKSGPLSFFATCPKGLELLLEQELASLGAVSCRVAVAGVYFSGDTQLAYMVCLWSRLANRVLLQLAAGKITSDDDLYHLARTVPWHTLFSVEARIHVEFIGTNDEIRHTRFGAQRVKDAVVDHFVAHAQARPSVDFILPDIRLCAYLSKGTVSLALNLAGESLHKRGYRCRATPAPLKENLAAALLLRAGCMWCGNAKAGEAEAFGFVDPMCGSGTLLIEAAMMCVDRAPGLGRALTESNTVTDKHFGFAAWLGHDEALWCRIVEAAQARFAHGLRVALDRDAPAWIRGFDVHPNAVAAARANAKAAGLDALIRIEKKALEALQASDLAERPARGWVITNPPYGERMGDKKTLESLYPCLGETLKRLFTPWQAAVFTGNRDLAGALRLRVKRKYRFYNGSIDSDLLLFDLLPAAEATLRTSPAGRIAEAALSDGSTMVLNRLRKNGKRLRRWLEQTGTSCYRLYDADMPEYACAVDVYQDQFHVQEYAAPKSVSATQAAKRFQELLAAVAVYGDRPLEAIVTKIRRRHAGASQYERQETATRFGDRRDFFTVREGPAVLQVNLRRYLDTGLFLDHRPLRRKLFELMHGKRFLNLFCYTATATVHAALGGAACSVSVDLSQTYLRWAAENLAYNDLNPNQHRLVNADCRTWLTSTREMFDVILLDPPTFSNSKKMAGVLDVQRDHVTLIRACLSRLAVGGALFFSTNQRTFSLDEAALASTCAWQDISAETLDPDFVRNPKVHRCWRFTRL